MIYNESCKKFTELLASDAPSPGGGGASAYAGAVAVALGDMVGEFTIGKKKYAEVESDIKALMEEAQELRIKLLDCMNKDEAAFLPLAEAYAMPKEDPTRDDILEECLKNAAAVPLEAFDLCLKAIDILEKFALMGSRIIISDAATGIALCQGAMKGCAVNVLVNTKLMKNREYAEKINAHIDTMMNQYSEKADKIYSSLYENFR